MEQARSQVEQLRREANVHRKKVSEAARELIEHCEKAKGGDYLIGGPSDGQNPFQEKKSCALL